MHIRKLAVISFLLLLFLSQGGYHIYYSVKQYQIKEAVKQELLATVPEALLDIIDADRNKNDIEWEEEGREFYLHGQMYDVAYLKTVNGKKLIYCLNDTREEGLLKDLSKLVSGNTNKPGGTQPGQHTAKFQSPDFIILSENIVVPEQAKSEKYFYRAEKLIAVITDLITPPPDQKSKNQTEIL